MADSYPSGGGDLSIPDIGAAPIRSFDSLATDGGPVQRHSRSDESLECLLINLLALMNVDGTAGFAFEAGVE